MFSRSLASPLISLVALLLLSGCHASVDREHYVAGETGSTRFANDSSRTVWLSGCSIFRFEQRVEGRWEDRGPPFVCIWEGFAEPVPPGESSGTGFNAPEQSGVWRLRYPVGSGCRDDQPLSACSRISPIYTKPFVVEREPCAPETSECRFVPGAPNFLCPDGENFGGPSGTCTRDPSTGVCGYEFQVCP
jgi:hypothetical protein